jgi:hypothetical protein
MGQSGVPSGLEVCVCEVWSLLTLPVEMATTGRLMEPFGTSRREVREAKELKRTAGTRRLEPLTSTVVRDVGGGFPTAGIIAVI